MGYRITKGVSERCIARLRLTENWNIEVFQFELDMNVLYLIFIIEKRKILLTEMKRSS